MPMTVKRVVKAMSKFKGDVEGKHFDNTKVYIEVNLDPTKGTMRGAVTQEYKTTDTSALYDRFAHVQLPAEFEIDFEEFSDKRSTYQMITAMRPVGSQKSA